MAGLAAAAAGGAAAFGVRVAVFVREFLRPSAAAGVLCSKAFHSVRGALDWQEQQHGSACMTLPDSHAAEDGQPHKREGERESTLYSMTHLGDFASLISQVNQGKYELC